VQSLAPQPSKRHAAKLFSSPEQYRLSIQKRSVSTAQPGLVTSEVAITASFQNVTS
jgi:hypothetical protein